MPLIYYILDTKNPENIYVGSTNKTLEQRLKKHYSGINSKHQTMIARYMKDKHFDDFEIYLIQECSDDERLPLEQQWIDDIGTLNKQRAYGHSDQEIKAKYRNNNREKVREQSLRSYYKIKRSLQHQPPPPPESQSE